LDTGALKQFAQDARRDLLDQVAARLEQVLRTDSVEIREQQKAVNELQRQINQSSQEAVIEKVAYTWFNRFCALRFMDVPCASWM
jgi:predicted outer membrane protein